MVQTERLLFVALLCLSVFFVGCGDDGSDSTAADGGHNGDTGSDAGVDSEIGDGFVEFSGANCDVSAGDLEENSKLPNPFEMNNGDIVSTFEEWRCRRSEIKADIEMYEIGPKPEPPTVEADYSDDTLTVTVTTDAGSIDLTSSVKMPSGDGPHPVVIGMAFGTGSLDASLFEDCIQVAFMHDQVVKNDHNSSTQLESDPYYTVYPDLFGEIGNYSAWSWGISRLIDGLVQLKDELNVDPERIAVTGCSYAGKMALFAGAFDERIALTIAQESGGGGINSWRLSKAFTDRTGIEVEKINNTNYGWFKNSMRLLDPNRLPYDHHELIAMIAPRAFLTLGNPPWEWLGDESGYKAVMAAKEVWKAMGLEERIGFEFSGGHTHCTAASSQNDAVQAFVDKFLYDKDADTDIAVEPSQSGFDLDWQDAIDWETKEIN